MDLSYFFTNTNTIQTHINWEHYILIIKTYLRVCEGYCFKESIDHNFWCSVLTINWKLKDRNSPYPHTDCKILQQKR